MSNCLILHHSSEAQACAPPIIVGSFSGRKYLTCSRFLRHSPCVGQRAPCSLAPSERPAMARGLCIAGASFVSAGLMSALSLRVQTTECNHRCDSPKHTQREKHARNHHQKSSNNGDLVETRRFATSWLICCICGAVSMMSNHARTAQLNATRLQDKSERRREFGGFPKFGPPF